MSITAVTKVLAGIPDLLFGIGSKSQTRDGNTVNVGRISIVLPLANIAALQALDVTNEDLFYPYAETLGFNSPGDGDARTWWFDVAEPIASDNGQTIFAGNGATVGCWKLANPVVLTGRGIITSGTIAMGPHTFTFTRFSAGFYRLVNLFLVDIEASVLAFTEGASTEVNAVISRVDSTRVDFRTFDAAGLVVDETTLISITILPES